MPEIKKSFGFQPLDGLMTNLKLKNEDLVKRSTEQLTFKQVRKGRLGVRLTPNIQQKITRALNSCVESEKFNVTDLFNY